MTDIELLKRSISILSNIDVPVRLTEQITLPILNVKSLLEKLLSVIEENSRKNQEESVNENAAEQNDQ